MINNLVTMDPSSDLIHIGKKRRSGRYPWGSGERPYQGEGPSFQKRKRGLLSFGKKKKEAQLSPIDQKLREAEYERAKRKAIKSGTATEVLMFKDSLSVKEMNDAINRITAERKLKEFSQKEKDDGWNAMNNAMKKVGDVKNWGQTVIDIYNMVDKQMNRSNDKGQKGSDKGNKSK